MNADVFIALDDDLIAEYAKEAQRKQTTVEVLLRRVLHEHAGIEHEPVTVADLVDNTRPHIVFDCRSEQ